MIAGIDELNHVLCYTVDLLLWLHIWQRIEVKCAVTLKKTGPNALQLLSVL